MKQDEEKILLKARRANPPSDPGGTDDVDDNGGRGRTGGDTVTERRTKEKAKTKRPPLYKCILLNDDYTPMEFVVEVLKTIFHRQHAEATRIMLHVHQNGMAWPAFILSRCQNQDRDCRGTRSRESVSAQVRDGKGVTGIDRDS